MMPKTGSTWGVSDQLPETEVDPCRPTVELTVKYFQWIQVGKGAFHICLSCRIITFNVPKSLEDNFKNGVVSIPIRCPCDTQVVLVVGLGVRHGGFRGAEWRVQRGVDPWDAE
jgi:hypothetical protein